MIFADRSWNFAATTVITQYGDCPKVNVNEDGITQVILNLFYNAIEAMDTEGTLTIQTEYVPETEVVHVRVQDDGTRNST